MEKPQVVVRRLCQQHQMSESQIVEQLASLGFKTSQPTINRLRRSKVGRASFDLAVGLNRLYDQVNQSVS